MSFIAAVWGVASGGVLLCVTEIRVEDIGGTEDVIIFKLMKSWRKTNFFLTKQFFTPQHCKPLPPVLLSLLRYPRFSYPVPLK